MYNDVSTTRNLAINILPHYIRKGGSGEDSLYVELRKVNKGLQEALKNKKYNIVGATIAIPIVNIRFKEEE